jgi:hypothetical protein
MTTPDWLARHDGVLRADKGTNAWVVLIEREPQYLLTPTPVAGKFGCEVMQTINGRRLESGNTYATAEEAVRGGLEDLRKALGW